MNTVTQSVSLDRTANIRTVVAISVAAVLLVWVMIHPTILGMAIICPAVIILVAVALFKAPWTVSVDDSGLNISSTLRTRRIPFEQIASVDRADVTAQRPTPLCSSGVLGYWGNYESENLGTYTACFGDTASCFLVTTTDGRRHMLGCNKPDTIIAAIKSRIQKDPENIKQP